MQSGRSNTSVSLQVGAVLTLVSRRNQHDEAAISGSQLGSLRIDRRRNRDRRRSCCCPRSGRRRRLPMTLLWGDLATDPKPVLAASKGPSAQRPTRRTPGPRPALSVRCGPMRPPDLCRALLVTRARATITPDGSSRSYRPASRARVGRPAWSEFCRQDDAAGQQRYAAARGPAACAGAERAITRDRYR